MDVMTLMLDPQDRNRSTLSLPGLDVSLTDDGTVRLRRDDDERLGVIVAAYPDGWVDVAFRMGIYA